MDYPTVDAVAVEEFENAMLQPSSSHDHVRSNPLEQLWGTIMECDIDNVVVVGSDWLVFKLTQWAAHKGGIVMSSSGGGESVTVTSERGSFRIILVPPADACPIPRGVLEAEVSRKQRWLDYFFGTPSSPLRSQVYQVSSVDCKFAQAGVIDTSAMQGLLPLDDDRAVDPTSISFVQVGDVPLIGRVLAVSSALFKRPTTANDDTFIDVPFGEFEKELKRMAVIGFVLVRDIVAEGPRSIISLLCPAPIPKGVCLLLTSSFLVNSRS